MTDLAEKLKNALSNNTKDNSQYGKLPSYEDILIIKSDPLRKQWDKLNIIRKNLLILDKYVKYNKGESLIGFLKKEGESGMSKLVLDKIGDKNDETGGIKAYFLSLQKHYDDEERKYDNLEIQVKNKDSAKDNINSFMIGRIDKREIRSKLRNSELKKLKDSKMGFFKQEEPKDLSANGYQTSKDVSIQKTISEKNKVETPQDKINRARKIVVSLAGVGILIGVGTAIYNSFKHE